MICFRNLCEVCMGTIAVCAHVKLDQVSEKAVDGGIGKSSTVKCITTSLLVTYAIITHRSRIFTHKKCVAVLNPSEVKGRSSTCKQRL